MIISKYLNTVKTVMIKNSPAILTAVSISGVFVTAYLAGKASFEASDILQNEEDLSIKESVKKVWPLYIPAGIVGITTIGSIVYVNKISSKRAAAAYSLMAISEKAFDEYKVKIIEKLGERKEKEVREEIAKDRIINNPPTNVLVSGNGAILCCELFTGRYFNSDMETLRKAQNDINAKLFLNMYVPLGEFYHLVGLPNTSYSWNVGWVSDKQMALDFSTVLSEDNRPCIAFDYNYTKPI